MLRSGVPLGYPAAAAFLQSVLGFILILVTNYAVRKTRPEMALF
jgi:ABC-type polysaccharide transport system permease subunit